MGITRKEKLVVETFCDLCGQSQGTTEIRPDEYVSWRDQTSDLLTFQVNGKDAILCWDCICALGKAREYNKRLNDLTYPKEGG